MFASLFGGHMNRVVGDNKRELAVRKLFGLSGPMVMHGCLRVFEDEIWTAFMKKEVLASTVRAHVRDRFCIPSSVKDELIDQIIAEVPLQ